MLNVKELINAAKRECTGAKDRSKTPAVIAQLSQIISNISPDTADWADLICFRARLQIKNHQAEDAVNALRPIVAPGGISSNNPEHHITYVKALVRNSSASSEITEHLRPLVVTGGLLSENISMQYVYLQALVKDNQIHEAAAHISAHRLLVTAPHTYVIYANALIRENMADEAAAYLRPHVSTGGVLSNNSPGLFTFARALIRDNKVDEAVTYLGSLVAYGGALSKKPIAHLVRAKILVKNNKAALAVSSLEPLIADGGLVSDYIDAHNVYAKALIQDNRAIQAEAHLRPMVADGCLLSTNPTAHYMLCKIYFEQGKKNEAMNVGLNFIRKTQGKTQEALMVGLSVLLAVFDERESGLTSLTKGVDPRILNQARGMAAKLKADENDEEILGSELYYGKRGTPLHVIETGGYRPISGADRIKAGLGRRNPE